MYSLSVGCCSLQPSPRPKSLMNYTIVSVDCQCRLFLVDLSSDGSIMVLKSSPIITGQLEKFEMEEKK